MGKELDRQEIVIRTEEDAWEVFTLALNGVFEDKDVDISFENWPVVDIKLTGEQYRASLTAKNMEGLIELQKTINRSYTLARYDTINTNKLTNEEKAQLEISFKVSNGSSGIVAMLEKALGTLAKDMAGKMETQHYIILILGAGLLWGGTVCWKTWLQHRKETKDMELRTEQRRIEEDGRQYASEQETERMKILASAYPAQPVLKRIKQNTDDMYNTILKSSTEADTLSIPGIQDIPGDVVKNLVRTKRSKSIEKRLDGIYRIKKVDSSQPDIFKVTVLNIETLDHFTAEVQDSYVYRGRNKQYFQDAEWNRQPVYLEVNAKMVRGSISRAIILSAGEIPEEHLSRLEAEGVKFELDESGDDHQVKKEGDA